MWLILLIFRKTVNVETSVKNPITPNFIKRDTNYFILCQGILYYSTIYVLSIDPYHWKVVTPFAPRSMETNEFLICPEIYRVSHLKLLKIHLSQTWKIFEIKIVFTLRESCNVIVNFLLFCFDKFQFSIITLETEELFTRYSWIVCWENLLSNSMRFLFAQNWNLSTKISNSRHLRHLTKKVKK